MDIVKKVIESNGVEISVYRDGLISIIARGMFCDLGGAFTIEEFSEVIKVAAEIREANLQPLTSDKSRPSDITPALCEGMPHGSCKGETMCDPNNACFKPA